MRLADEAATSGFAHQSHMPRASVRSYRLGARRFRYGAFAARMRYLGSPTVMAWLRPSFAATFMAVGAKLALMQR